MLILIKISTLSSDVASSWSSTCFSSRSFFVWSCRWSFDSSSTWSHTRFCSSRFWSARFYISCTSSSVCGYSYHDNAEMSWFLILTIVMKNTVFQKKKSLEHTSWCASIDSYFLTFERRLSNNRDIFDLNCSGSSLSN